MFKQIKVLRQKKADLIKDARGYLDISDKAETEEQKAAAINSYDASMVELEAVKAKLERLEHLHEEEKNLAQFPSDDDVSGNVRVSVGDERVKPFANMGDLLSSIYKQATNQSFDPRLAKQAAATGAGEAVASEGGYLVPMDMASDLIKRTYENGSILSRVRKMPISANSNGITINAVDETSRADGSRVGGIRGYWVDEAGSITASQPKFRQMELKLKKVAALLYATDELLEDTMALENLIQEEVPKELAFKVEDAIVNGDGAGKPKGFNVTTGNSPLVSVSKETGQLANTIVFENIVKMWARMYAPSRTNAVWLINQDIEPQLYSMGLDGGTASTPAYMPPGGLSVSPYATLMGRPVLPVEHCATLGTAGDIMLVDLSQYMMIDKGGINQASSIHVRFVNHETAFRFTYRVDGQPIWNSALTPFKGTNTLSPFVRLATRA